MRWRAARTGGSPRAAATARPRASTFPHSSALIRRTQHDCGTHHAAPRISASVTGCPLASTRAQDRYGKYRGQTVVISVPAHPHYDAMQKLLPAFTKETGIKVEVDKLQILRMKDKQLLEMAKPQGDYDIAVTRRYVEQR